MHAGQVPRWKAIPIIENNDPLVAIGPGTPYPLYTSAIYYGQRLDSPYFGASLGGSLLTIFVRRHTAASLMKASQGLPPGHHLVIFDGFRPPSVQAALFDHYKTALQHHRPTWTEEQILAETQRYVSLPSTVASRPAPHNTGGTVDVGIYTLNSEAELAIGKQFAAGDDRAAHTTIARKAQLLDFGTPFDYGGPAAALAYYETIAELTAAQRRARHNRRILYGAMTQAGFVGYAEEWWHYNAPESQMGAAASGRTTAAYGAVKLTPAQERYEQQQRAAWQAAVASDPRRAETSLQPAVEITPPSE